MKTVFTTYIMWPKSKQWGIFRLETDYTMPIAIGDDLKFSNNICVKVQFVSHSIPEGIRRVGTTTITPERDDQADVYARILQEIGFVRENG